MGVACLLLRVLLGATFIICSVTAIPIIPLEEAFENAAENFPKDVDTIEKIQNLSDKSARQFGFLNILSTLNKLGNLGDLSNILNNAVLNGNTNANNNGVQATTPRLNGRPGLGFIPDIPKGIDRILSGVAAGNLEQILEGSFVFAPTGVQKVAGTVLDRVFISTTPASAQQLPGKNSTLLVPLKQLTTQIPVISQQTTISSKEAQMQLQQILKQQFQLQQLQAQLQQQANRLQNVQQKQGSEQEDVGIDRVAQMPITSTTQTTVQEVTERVPDQWVRADSKK